MSEPAPAPALASVREQLRRGVQLLSAAGCDSPRLDAELLLAAALSVDRAGLVIRSQDAVSADFAGALWDAAGAAGHP